MPTDKLEYKLLFAIVVAGKSAKFAQAKMLDFASFLFMDAGRLDFFVTIRKTSNEMLEWCIKSARMGNYRKLCRAFREVAIAKLDLWTCTAADLEKIHGIGPKTARFFLLWTRDNERVAALDVHILRWMRAQGYDVPKSTPSGKRYAAIEQWFLWEADQRGLTARELDAQIWLAANKSGIRS